MEILRVDGERSQEFLKYALEIAPQPIDGILSVSIGSSESMVRFAGLPNKLLRKLYSFDDGFGGFFQALLRIDSGNFQDFMAHWDLLAHPQNRIVEGKLNYDRWVSISLTEVTGRSVVGVVIYQKMGAYDEKFRPEGLIGNWLDNLEAKFPGCSSSGENQDSR